MSSESRNDMGPVLGTEETEKYKAAHDVFHEVKDDVVKKIHELHHNDQVHGLHSTDNLRTIAKYILYKFAVEDVSYGRNYFGKILIAGDVDHGGKFVHARAFKGTRDGDPVVEFYSLHTNLESNATSHERVGAIWTVDDELKYFND